MNPDQPSSSPPRRRFWLKLLLWSAVGTGMIFSAITPDFTSGGVTMTRRLMVIQMLRLAIIGAFVLVNFFIIAKCWPRRPKTERGWFIFGVSAFALGLLTVSWFMWAGRFQRIEFLGTPLAMFSAMMIGFYAWLLLVLGSAREFFRWLRCRRNLIRCSLAVLLPLGALVFFYHKENARGQRAWETCRRELAAQGQKFSLRDYAPPPVPDEKNFALAPIITTTYANASGYESGPAPKNVENRLLLSLDRKDDAKVSGRHIGDWRIGNATDLQAWQKYFRLPYPTNDDSTGAIPQPIPPPFNNIPQDPITNDFPVTEHAQSPAADVLTALSKFTATLDEVRAAATRPFSRFPLDYGKVDEFEIYGSWGTHQYSLNTCARVLQLRAVAEVQSDQIDAAFDDVKLILRLSEALTSEPTFNSALARRALASLSLQPIWEGLVRHTWNAPQLVALQEILARQDFLTDWPTTWRATLLRAVNSLEYEKTNRNDFATMLLFMNCHIDEQNFNDFLRMPGPLAESMSQVLQPILDSNTGQRLVEQVKHIAPDGWFDLEKVGAANELQRMLTAAATPAPHQMNRDKISQLTKSFASQSRSSAFRYYAYNGSLFTEQMAQDAAAAARQQAAVDLAMLACALERFHLDQHDYPASLEALTPKYLEKIPLDVVNGQPLHYQRKSKDAFKLYSVGWNGTDDGGNTNLRFFGRRLSDTDDWVWEYPP